MRAVSVVSGVAVGAILLLGIGGAAAEPDDERLAGVETWGFAIGNKTLKGNLAERYAAYDLIVLDGQEARRRHIAALQAQETIVLGYLSVGTIETYRPWYKSLKPYRLEAWKDWKGEFFAKVGKRGFRRKIGKRIAPKLLAKGFDGLFLDNVDMIEAHRREAAGMRKLVGSLGRLVHRDGGLLFAQNGFEIIDPFLPHLDGWNREDVSTLYDFDRERYRRRGAGAVRRAQAELRSVAGEGLLVTATDYTRRAGGRTADRAVVNACAAGALAFVSDIGLSRVPSQPPLCG